MYFDLLLGYWTLIRDFEQGTPEFMSRALRKALDFNDPYMQSPVDDMHSFFWVAYWAVLHPSGLQTEKELRLRRRIEGTLDVRQAAVEGLLKASYDPAYSALLRTMAPLLQDWHASLRILSQDFCRTLLGLKELDSRLLRLLFHRFAYRGMTDFVDLLAKHREISKAAPGPAPST